MVIQTPAKAGSSVRANQPEHLMLIHQSVVQPVAQPVW
jgi:hypothetical protein